MLNNLTSSFISAMEDDSRTPIQVVVFHFATGDVFLSDRDIVLNGQLYTGIVESWGEMVTVGAENAVSSTATINITLWDGGNNRFSDNFLAEDPVDVFVDLYQTFEGLLEVDYAHIGEFVIQDPIEVSESSQLLDMELVTTNMRYTAQVGNLITKEVFENAPSISLNKSIDLIVGDAGRVQCLCVNKPPVTSLDRSVVRSTVTIEMSDNLDDLNFLQSGLVQVNDEDIVYSSRGEYVIYASQRGANGTTARDHPTGSEVIQGNIPVKYLVGQSPINSITDIWVEGKPTSLTFTTELVDETWRVVFPKQPVYEDATNTKEGGVYFDTTMASNTARHPTYAYDNTRKSDGAEIDSDNRSLVISNQHDLLATNGNGEIVNVFLDITSWATVAYTAQRVDVVLDGVGTVGRLTRPNEAAVFNLEADVDIDHPHEHAEGAGHDHDAVTLDYDTEDPGHPHDLTNVTSQFSREPTVENVTEEVVSNDAVNRTKTFVMTIPFEQAPGKNVTSSQIAVSIEFYENAFGTATNLKLSTRDGSTYNVDDFTSSNKEKRRLTINAGSWDTAYTTHNIWVKLSGTISSGAAVSATTKIRIGEATFDCTVTNEAADPAIANVVTNKTGDGTVAQRTLDTSGKEIQKKADDVDELAVDNREINVKEGSGTYSQSFTDSFDLLDHYPDMDWDFLSNRQVSLNFVGVEGVTVFVTWIQFVVEYRPSVLKTTDDISCNVVGGIDSRPDAVVEYLLTQKAGLPVEKLSSVYRSVEVPTGTPDGGDVWGYDEAGDPVPGAAFEEASGWFNHKGYTIDGVIPGNLSVKEAIENITFQARCKLLWQNGLAKLSIKRKAENWQAVKDLPIEDIQIASYELKRSEVAEIVNKIDLFYNVDRLDDADGAGQYEETISIKDQPSIDKHGEKVNDDKWLFDLVRNSEMAEDVAEYYLWELGESSTYYTFKTYLKHFDLEKEDYATINSYRFARLKQLPIVIKEIQREYGSGKLGKINVLKLVCQSIRHYVHQVIQDDIVSVSDSLDIDFGMNLSFEDVVHTGSILDVEWGREIDETILVSDALDILFLMGEAITETITVESELSCHMDMVIEDTVTTEDYMYAYAGSGFGVGPFGTMPFGSRQDYIEQQVEVQKAKDEVSFDMDTGIEDTQTVEDSVSFSGGFGGNGLGSGFGLAPFGR